VCRSSLNQRQLHTKLPQLPRYSCLLDFAYIPFFKFRANIEWRGFSNLGDSVSGPKPPKFPTWETLTTHCLTRDPARRCALPNGFAGLTRRRSRAIRSTVAAWPEVGAALRQWVTVGHTQWNFSTIFWNFSTKFSRT